MPINQDLDPTITSLCTNCKAWRKKIESCKKLTLCFPHKILECEAGLNLLKEKSTKKNFKKDIIDKTLKIVDENQKKKSKEGIK